LKADLSDQRGILETTWGEFDLAVKSFDDALDLKRQVLDKTNAELAKLFVDKAAALRACGKHKEALDNLEEAQNIINPLFNENHLFFARIFLEFGRTYYDKKSYVAAKEQLEDALKIYLAQPNQDLREHAGASETLGLVHLETGLASKASQLFGDALEIKKSIYDSQHPEIAKTLYNEARALLKMEGAIENRGKHRAAARQKLEDALQILKSNGQNGIEQVQEIESTLSTL
jgi:tetratricopeptide (TPR) repeat protein